MNILFKNTPDIFNLVKLQIKYYNIELFFQIDVLNIILDTKKFNLSKRQKVTKNQCNWQPKNQKIRCFKKYHDIMHNIYKIVMLLKFSNVKPKCIF